jgi:hypothetical protein
VTLDGRWNSLLLLRPLIVTFYGHHVVSADTR